MSRTKAISPKLTRSPFDIPNCPTYIKLEGIRETNNLPILKKIEKEYDEFLDKKCQILLLLNIIDEVFEIRDAITLRIKAIEREQAKIKIRRKYNM